MKRHLQTYPLWIPLLLGAVLRIVHLGGRSFWNDEGLTAVILNGSLTKMIANVNESTNNGYLYYLVAFYWGKIFGVNEFSLGLLSAVAGLITIYFAYRFVRLIADKKTAFLCALITAVSPFMVYASYEARPGSAFLGMFAIMTMYYFLRALQENKIKFWLLSGILTALCGYIHLLGLSLALAELLYVLISPSFRKKTYLIRTLLMLLGAFIIYLPQMNAAIQQIERIVLPDYQASEMSLKTSLLKVPLYSVKQLLGGGYRLMNGYYFMDLGGAGMRAINRAEIVLFIFTLLSGLGLPLLVLVYLLKKRPPWGLFIMLFYLTPFIQVFWEGVDPRKLTPSSIPLYAALALAFFSWKKPTRTIIAAVFLLTSFFALGKMYSMTSAITKPEDYRQMSRIISQQGAEDEVTLFYGGPSSNAAWIYYDPGNTIFGSENFSQEVIGMYFRKPAEEILNPEYFTYAMDNLLDSYKAVWLVFSNYNMDEIKAGIENYTKLYDIKLIFKDDYNLLYKVDKIAAPTLESEAQESKE